MEITDKDRLDFLLSKLSIVDIDYYENDAGLKMYELIYVKDKEPSIIEAVDQLIEFERKR